MFGLFSIFGNVFGGVLFDKLGLSKSFILAGILVVLAGLCLLFVGKIMYLDMYSLLLLVSQCSLMSWGHLI